MKITLRTLALLLASLTLVLCLAACGGKGGSASNLEFKSPDGVAVPMNAESAPIIEALGKWISMNASDSCGGFQGKDYRYAYNGFNVYTTPALKSQVICKVEITDDSITTPQGLRIGMSRADVEKAMASFTAEQVGDNLAYTMNGTKLQVVFRDGTVTGIIYVAA
jgi:predicted small lipoprotein YifL